jgi:hypothetical protein
MDIIRQQIGLCSQTDVIYDDLTVEEHLEYYGKLKGFYGENLRMDMEEVIVRTNLQNERKKQSSTLSGTFISLKFRRKQEKTLLGHRSDRKSQINFLGRAFKRHGPCDQTNRLGHSEGDEAGE